MAKRIVYYIKYSRRNGQVGLLCDPGTNNPQMFYDVEDAKKIASSAKNILNQNSKNKSPAQIERVWIFKTTKTV